MMKHEICTTLTKCRWQVVENHGSGCTDEVDARNNFRQAEGPISSIYTKQLGSKLGESANEADRRVETSGFLSLFLDSALLQAWGRGAASKNHNLTFPFPALTLTLPRHPALLPAPLSGLFL